MEPEVLKTCDLADLPAARGPFDPEPYVLIELARAAPGMGELAGRLSQLSVPVIGIGTADMPLAALCDAVLDESSAAVAVSRIRRTPLAAMTLVQLLRSTVGLEWRAALVAESLAYATLQGGPEFARWRATRAPKPVAVHDPGPPVILERGAAALEIRLNRPSRANAISVEMRDALVEAFELVALDRSIGRAIVRANGRDFSTGGDLDEFGTTPDPATAHAVRTLRLPARALLACRDRVEFELHGACVGAGIELPAFAPRVRARRDARFSLPEMDFGLLPGAGGCVSLPRRIGRQRTAELALTGRAIDAHTALAWGLIDALID